MHICCCAALCCSHAASRLRVLWKEVHRRTDLGPYVCLSDYVWFSNVDDLVTAVSLRQAEDRLDHQACIGGTNRITACTCAILQPCGVADAGRLCHPRRSYNMS
jgi:hypothetical protein